MHIDADIWSVKQSTPLHWMKGFTGANVLLPQYFWGISISHTFSNNNLLEMIGYCHNMDDEAQLQHGKE